ncbi:MAG: alpha/beta hydrolase family protein [Promethearchaeota archaeon]
MIKMQKKLRILVIFLFFAVFFGGCINSIFSLSNNPQLEVKNKNLISPSYKNTKVISGFANITEFWKVEKGRIDSSLANLWIHSSQLIVDEKTNKKYNKTELSYEVPNWIDASPSTFRINATLFTPSNETGNLGKIPGFALFHGLNGRRQDNYPYAIDAITKENLNIAILCPDHPGHGESGGPPYKPENWYYTGDFNKTSHNYLAIMAGLRAIKILLGFNFINSSQIGAGGFSYGGLTSMWISSIYSDIISVCMPVIATGGLIYADENSLIYDVMKKTPDDLGDFWDVQGKEIDPLFYTEIDDFPDICWFIGTNDDFFPLEGINASYNAVKSDSTHKWLQISPNAHHGLFDFAGTYYFMINHSFFNGPAPPNTNILQAGVIRSLHHFNFDKFYSEIEINSEIAIKKVEIIYRYRDIFADPWRRIEMNVDPSNSSRFHGIIPAPWHNSNTEYYIVVHLNISNGDNVWFSSPIYYAAYLKNDFQYFYYILIILSIFGPIAIILYFRFKKDVIESADRASLPRRTNGANVSTVTSIQKNQPHNTVIKTKFNKELRNTLKNCFITETILVFIGEIIILLSLWLPWIDWGTVEWDHIYLFESVGTYTDILGDLAYFTFPLLVGFWIFIFYIALINPLKGGFFNFAWPLLVVLVTTIGTTQILQLPSICGYGELVFIVGSALQFITGIWQKQYRKRLKIVERRFFHYFRKQKFRQS